MSDIDYALAYDFIDPSDGIARQLRFERNWAPPGDRRIFDGTGQLVAVVAEYGHPRNGDTLPISRPDVQLSDVNNAINGWETWAAITDTTYNLAPITRRINSAGLGYHP
ncbi:MULTISPECIES: hypothetical protein [Mycobacterium]|uniref:hypothetical protein n=1 Tax=Mycobacterium TaxID=1763 RepID=UPI0019806FC5|nr:MULTISPECIES: hypothetical protein [Mycobacterium]MDP7706899.1 hypothetical protein [Mycobacterium sp. TY815]